MPLKYLQNKSWSEISREERYFCSILFEIIRKKPLGFIKFLNTKFNLNYNIKIEWEAGFEVCFYRDFFKAILNESIKNSKFSSKRTFDLCLFSNENIIIIEAKSHQGFEKKQMEEFCKDIIDIQDIIKYDVKIDLIGLASSIYYSNYEKYGNKSIYKCFNEKLISWIDLYIEYEEPLFKQADNTYKK